MTSTRTRAGQIRRILGPVACGAVAVAGCSGDEDYANRARPPTPINVTAAITDERVEISPRRFGAGPIVLIVANQSARSQELTLETEDVAGGKPGIRQTTSPINPRGTAELKVGVSEGTYTISVDGDAIASASIEVGAERESAQNRLLQP